MLWQERGVVNSVVELGSSSVGLVVYRREEGEETVNTEQKDASLRITCQYAVQGVT